MPVPCRAALPLVAALAWLAACDSPHAGRLVKPRTVTVHLGTAGAAERELREGPNGELEYGALTRLDDVTVCVRNRRDAYAHFQLFDELEEPLPCADDEGRIEGVPADSDLVLTWEAPGLLPASSTLRTDAFELSAGILGGISTPMLRPGAFEPWSEPAGPLGEGEGLAILFVAMQYVGPTLESEPPGQHEQIGGADFGIVVLGDGVSFVIEPADEAAPLEVSSRGDRPLFLRLPEGSARFAFEHPRANCQPVGAWLDYPGVGLPIDDVGGMEVPVLEGHTTLAVIDCWCVPELDAGPLVDLATCTFETGPVDAGSP